MTKLIKRIQVKIAIARWSVLPDWLWFLVASPLLKWALGAPGPWFALPRK